MSTTTSSEADLAAGCPAPLPAGEITILFTDVEGSTSAWERHPQAMPQAMRRHKGIVEQAVAAHGGVVVKDTGDGLFAVFSGADEAVAAAVDAQRGLESSRWDETGPLRARMGLHSGEAEPIAGDYHGPAVNRCARIMGVAHGGQIVVSSATRERITAVDSGTSFLDLGLQRLRDLSTPVHLFQVLDDALPGRFPPLRSLDAVANNLPAELSSFIGRESELTELAGALQRSRLLTLTGPGGVGKTRLALQLAADQADHFADGVWLAVLGGLAEPTLVAPAVAAALRIDDQPGRTWVDSVLWHLRGRQTLLVLDNCEHLLDEVSSLVVAILRGCPRVRVMTTSREALRLTGETVWHVPPLSLSVVTGASEAERLFIERARDVEPRYRPDQADAAAIHEICSRLDGIPLAIELAAARERMLSAREIADRLHERFRLLTGGSRTALPRQRTLEATVAWSYEMLSGPERQLFDRLSVFASRFTLDAVTRVCGDGDVRGDDVLDLLTSLADRSLVVHERAATTSRYRLLETMRAYGLDRLGERGEVAALRDAHLAWVNDFARSAAGPLDSPEQEVWLGRVSETLDDIRVALAWALEGDRTVTGVGCAASLYRYWYVRNVREGREWLDRLLAAADDVPPKLLAKALFTDGSLAQALGDNAAAIPVLERSLALYRELHNDRGLAWALHALGMAQWAVEEPERVRRSFDEALEIFTRLPDLYGVSFAHQFLAAWEFTFGDLGRAAEHAAEQLALLRLVGMPPYGAAHTLETSAVAAWKRPGGPGDPAPLFREALLLYRTLGSPLCAAHCLGNLAGWVLDHGAVRDAARLQGAMVRLRDDAGRIQPAPYEQPLDEPTREQLIAVLGPDEYEREVRNGRVLDLEDAVDAALAIVDVIGHEAAQGAGR